MLQAWDAFYILATELAYKAKGFEFEVYINEFMHDVVFPAFSRFLANCQEPKTKLSARRECIKRMLSLDINHTADVDISYVTSILPAVTKCAASAFFVRHDHLLDGMFSSGNYGK